jgi:hypothetical protein
VDPTDKWAWLDRTWGKQSLFANDVGTSPVDGKCKKSGLAKPYVEVSDKIIRYGWAILLLSATLHLIVRALVFKAPCHKSLPVRGEPVDPQTNLSSVLREDLRACVRSPFPFVVSLSNHI